jgi:hypothetical protein
MTKFEIYRKLIDIDYYVYFTKAYFAFNAYLKAKYPEYNDREKIEKVKQNTIIKTKFINLLNEGKHFKDDLSSLSVALHNAQIKNQEEFILFTKVKINQHEERELFNNTFNRVRYFIKSLNGEKFTFTVNGYNSQPFKYEELETKLSESSLSQTQKDKVKLEIEQYIASYSVNLQLDINKLPNIDSLDTEEKNQIIDRLYKGFIEIIYLLRNSLFHSEVEPNSDVMKVYKFAYFILRKILHEIPI